MRWCPTSSSDPALPESFLSLEAQFYLGKVYLAQERVQLARGRFGTVVEREGRMAAEARDILKVLEKEYPERLGK